MSSTKKKIIVFVDWFYPGYKGGGPIRSCINLVSLLQHHYEVKVVTRNVDLGETTPYPEINSNQWIPFGEKVKVMYLSADRLSFSSIKNILKQEQPDHVYLNSMYSVYFTIVPLLVNKLFAPSSVYTIAPRGMLYDSAVQKKVFKKKIFLALIKRFVINRRLQFHATNENEIKSIQKYFPRNPVQLADNLPEQQQKPFQSCLKRTGTLKCIFVARIDKIKNLLLLLELLKNVRANIELHIIGPVEDDQYWDLCKKAIEVLPASVSITVSGAVSHSAINEHLLNSQLFVLLTRGENFGHSIFESLLAGRPVLISDQTPWRNLESKRAGWDLPLADTQDIVEKLQEAASWDQETFDIWARSAWDLSAEFLKNNKSRERYFNIFG